MKQQHINRIRRWRRFQVFGGLVLASAFFMPAVPGCSSDIVPAGEMWDLVRAGSLDIAEWIGGFVLFASAYLFGLLSAVVAWRRYKPAVEPEKGGGLSIAVLFGGVAIVLIMGIAKEAIGGMSWKTSSALLGVFILASFAYWLRGIRMGPSGLLCLRWYAALCCGIWFGFWFFTGDALYGVWVSWLGALVLLVALYREAKLRSRLGHVATVWKLLTCRLKFVDGPEPRCFHCGYLLIGLTVPRCPECGEAFEWEEYDLPTPDQICTPRRTILPPVAPPPSPP